MNELKQWVIEETWKVMKTLSYLQPKHQENELSFSSTDKQFILIEHYTFNAQGSEIVKLMTENICKLMTED